jgi:radical SAM superfamily enzyme YgiQ (UPF0313 family)
VGPAVSSHPKFEELLARLQGMDADLSVSSLRIKPLSETALGEMTKGKAKTIALAPEAGSRRLRDIINKGITEDDIYTAFEKTAGQGIRQLKLYFMVGLPTETDYDIEEIIDLTLKCKSIMDRKNPGCRITLSVAPFVPKAGTPFQWLPMEKLDTLNRRISLLKKRLPASGIQVKTDSPAWSRVQAVLSRGDTSLAAALADIEDFSLSGWQAALDRHHIDIDSLLYRRLDASAALPWSVIDSGTAPGRLEKELSRALG